MIGILSCQKMIRLSVTLMLPSLLLLWSLLLWFLVEVNRYGFFSSRCRYLEIRAADGRYMILFSIS